MSIGHTLWSALHLEPYLWMRSPWSLTCVLWSVALHMCEPTCIIIGLFVRALAHICIVGLPHLSYI
jgi:hypothetical protein